MLTGTNDERHNLFYAGVFPCQRKSEKETKRQKEANKQTKYENKE